MEKMYAEPLEVYEEHKKVKVFEKLKEILSRYLKDVKRSPRWSRRQLTIWWKASG